MSLFYCNSSGKGYRANRDIGNGSGTVRYETVSQKTLKMNVQVKNYALKLF